MMMSKCKGGCGLMVGWAFAAQYRDNQGKPVIVCPDCWAMGMRMWINPDGSESVGAEGHPGSSEAVLYYDEGGYATGRTSKEMTYPSTKQPGRAEQGDL